MMEQVRSHSHLLSFPLPADQPSHPLHITHLLPSRDTQDIGWLSLNSKCLSALFDEQHLEWEGRGHAFSKTLCTEGMHSLGW